MCSDRRLFIKFYFILNFEFISFTDICLDIFQSFYNCLMQAIANEEAKSANTMLLKCEKLWHSKGLLDLLK